MDVEARDIGCSCGSMGMYVRAYMSEKDVGEDERKKGEM